jgi:hypothetical protein
VSKLWKELYAQLPSVTIKACSASGRRRTITCQPHMTPYSSVFASPARVKLAREAGVKFTAEKFKHAAGAYADVAALAAAHELGMKYSTATLLAAARCNKLAVLQFLHAEGCPWDATVVNEAAKRGELEMVRWLHESGCEWNDRWVLYYAAEGANVELLDYVKQRVDVAFTGKHMQKAAERGQTAVCEYLRSQQCPFGQFLCTSAARNGHTETLHWLRQQPEYMFQGARVCEEAARCGHMEVLQYLLSEGLLVNPARLTCRLNTAGANDQLAAAQWLRQQGAQWPPVLQHQVYSIYILRDIY